jgi:hypothetical protein
MSQTYDKRHEIQHTRAQTCAHANEGTSEEKEITFRIDVLFWRHLIEVKKSRITMFPWQTHAVEHNLDFNHQHFETPQGILWNFLCGTVRSTVSRIYLKRLVLLLMQLSQRKLRRLTGLTGLGVRCYAVAWMWSVTQLSSMYVVCFWFTLSLCVCESVFSLLSSHLA